MRTRIQKWGNSLGLRIPRAYAREAQIEQHTLVDLTVVDGQLVVRPVEEPPSLQELLAGVTDENLHAELDTGRPVGREQW
jgi:antitoxin MazE